MQFAETSKVGIFKEDLARFVHPFKIQRAVVAVDLIEVKGIFMQGQIVSIGAGNRIEPGMGVRNNRNNLINRNVGRQYTVQFISQEREIRQRLLHLKMSHHPACMDTCIGTSCSDNRNFTPKNS